MSDKIGYVLKVYPRFSETFIVTEVISREAQGERIEIFTLRPTTDERFHPALGRVQAPVTHSRKPHKLEEGWQRIADASAEVPGFSERFAALLPMLSTLPASDVTQAVELAAWATRGGITHLHAHFASLAGQSVAIAGRLAGIPYSVTTHAKDIFHESVNHDVLRFIIEGAHHVVTISAYNHRFLSRLFPDLAHRLRLIRNGLDLTRFPYSDPRAVHSPVRIVSVGRLVEKKGFDLLVSAADELRRQGIDVDVRIAGGGELTEQIQAQIDELGLGVDETLAGPSTLATARAQGTEPELADARPASPSTLASARAQGTEPGFPEPAAHRWSKGPEASTSSVRLLGPRSQEEIVELLGWADVFAAPCRVGTDGNADGLPTVLLEAMAVGLPVVAGDVTGIGEAVRNGVTGIGEAVRNGVTGIGEADRNGVTGIGEADRTGLTDIGEAVRNGVTGIGEADRNPEAAGGGARLGADATRTGFLIPPDDVGALVDALKAAVSPTLNRAKLARNARAVVETEYDSVRQVAKLKEAQA